MNFKTFLKELEEKPSEDNKTYQEQLPVLRITIPGVKELRDGLTEDIIRSKYDWLVRANVKDAILGIKDNIIIWYNGEWLDGEAKNLVFETGTWKNGKFSGIIKNVVWQDGTFVKGEFWGGTWKKGTFQTGRFLGGEWLDGVFKGDFFSGKWRKGFFEHGIFGKGEFLGGVFKNGTFNGGIFSGGTFEGGKWLKGKWKKGIWVSGINEAGEELKSPPIEEI